MEKGQQGWVQGLQLSAKWHTTALLGFNERGHLTVFVYGSLTVKNGKSAGLGANNVTLNGLAVDLESGEYDMEGTKFPVDFRARGDLKAGTGSIRKCFLFICHNEPVGHASEDHAKTSDDHAKESEDTTGASGGN